MNYHLSSRRPDGHPGNFHPAIRQRRAAAHEGVGDNPAGKVVRAEEGLRQRSIAKLCQHQATEKRARPPGEPLVDSDDGSVVLLDPLLFQRQLAIR